VPPAEVPAEALPEELFFDTALHRKVNIKIMVTVNQPENAHRTSTQSSISVASHFSGVHLGNIAGGRLYGTGAVEAHCEVTNGIILYRNDTFYERGGKFFTRGLSASGHSRQATLCAIDVLLQKLERIGRLKSVPTRPTRGISLTT